MPFIWNDHAYWDRYLGSVKYFVFILIPLILLSMLFWYIFEPKAIKFIQLIFISSTTGFSLYGLLGIFFLFPNANIPEYYHPIIKRFIYCPKHASPKLCTFSARL